MAWLQLTRRTYTVWDIVTLSFRSAPWAAGMLTLLKIGEGLAPTLSILATAAFVDTAIGVAQGAREMSAVWLPLAFVALLVALVVQFRVGRYVAWSYWFAVSMVGIFGTILLVVGCGFGAFTLWEASSRYVMLYFILLIPLAALGLELTGRSLRESARRLQKRARHI